jgi:hypothetical protein
MNERFTSGEIARLEIKRPDRWDEIVAGKEWADAKDNPEARLDTVIAYKQHLSEYLPQVGYSPDETKQITDQFWKDWRGHAIDNGVNPFEHVSSELLTSLTDTVFGSVAGNGLIMSVQAETGMAKEDARQIKEVPLEDAEKFRKQYLALKPGQDRDLFNAGIRSKYGIEVLEEDGETFVDYASAAETGDANVTFDPMALVGSVLRIMGGGAKAESKSAIEDKLRKNPRLAEKFLTGDLPRAAGSALGFIGGAAVAGAPGVVSMGIGSQAESAYFTAKKAGATGDQIEAQVQTQGAIGALEGLGLGGLKWIDRTPFGKTVKQGVARYLFGGVKEGAQEVLAGALVDVSEKYGGIDPERNILDGEKIARTFGASFITGAIGDSVLIRLDERQQTVAIKAQIAMNEVTRKEASAVLDGSHPAIAPLRQIIDGDTATPEVKAQARQAVSVYEANANELLQSVRESEVAIQNLPLGLEILNQGNAPRKRKPANPSGMTAPNAPQSKTKSETPPPIQPPTGMQQPAAPDSGPSRITPDPIVGEGTKQTREILFDAATSLGVNIQYKGTNSQALGTYYPGNAKVAIKYEGDLDTTSHEVAHKLDDSVGLLASWNVPRKVSKFDQELAQFWVHGSVRKKSTLQYKRAEGVAEFVRAWLVNPNEAMRAAPKFAQHFIETVPAQTIKDLRAFGDDIRRFAGAEGLQQVSANVEWQPSSGIDKMLQVFTGKRKPGFKLTAMDQVKTQFTDDMRPFIAGVEFAKTELGRTEIAPSQDPVLLARLYRGINGKFEDIFDRGMVDKDGNRVTEGGISWLLEPLDSSSKEALEAEAQETIAFMIAERTLEKAKQLGRTKGVSGIGAGVIEDTKVAERAIAEVEANPEKAKRIKEAARRYREWGDATLRYMRDKGRISEKQYQGIKERNEAYVAMKRILEVEPGVEISDHKGAIPGNGIGQANQSILKRFKGSSKVIENPYLELFQATQKAIKEADRNEIMLAFTDLLTQARSLYQGKPNDIGSVGSKTNADDLQKVPVFRDGRREHWRFDQDINETLKNLSELQPLKGPVADAFTLLPRLLREGITKVPAFAIRNVQRDTQHRLQVSRARGKDSIVETFNVRGNMNIEDLQRFGGDHSGHYSRDKIDWARALDSAIADLAKKPGEIVLDPRLLWKGYEKLLQASERYNRVAEFNASEKYAKEVLGYGEKDSKLYAALQARDLIDFTVAGRVARIVNQFVPFTNAGIQGLRRSVKSAAENPIGFAARWTLYALVPTLIAKSIAAAGGYEDELDEQPDYIRDIFWNFKISPDTWLRIPRNFETGVLAAGADRLVDVATGRKTAGEAFKGYSGSIFHVLSPIDEMSLLGPYQGMIQALLNYDLFREKNIVSPIQEDVDLNAVNSKGERIRQSETASRFGQAVQKLSEMAGLSGTAIGRKILDARKIDFLTQSVLGSAGDAMLRITNTGRKDTNRVIGLKDTGLFVNSPAYASQSVQEVYELASRKGIVTTSRAFRTFNAAADKYFEAKTPEERDAAAEKWRQIAREMIPYLEGESKDRENRAKKQAPSPSR